MSARKVRVLIAGPNAALGQLSEEALDTSVQAVVSFHAAKTPAKYVARHRLFKHWKD